MSSVSDGTEAEPEDRDNIRELLGLLNAEEQRVALRLRGDDRGLLLRVALSEIDWHDYSLRKRIEPTAELLEQSHVVGMGLQRIVTLMLRFHKRFTVPTITIRRDDRLVGAAIDIGAELGFVQHGRRTAELAWAGLARVSRPEPALFDFVLPARMIDGQAHERDVEEHLRLEFRRLYRKSLENSPDDRRKSMLVRELLRENVFVWRQDFMGYDADPVLDDYFLAEAWREVAQTPQYDAFNELKTFGGIPYLKYLLASAILVSFSLKHERFARAAVERFPELRIEDILTITADRDGYIETIREALNQFGPRFFANYTETTADEARAIFEVVALTRRNVGLIEKPYAPLPVTLEFSDIAVVKLVSGRHRQMEFLLDSLKSAFPRDYARNQQSREASMQRAIEGFLARHFPTVIVRRNVRLRLAGRDLTDVDLAAFDPDFGNLFLFQLKFQDSHVSDFKVRQSRLARFLNETRKWLSTVEAWLKSLELEGLRATFQIPKGVALKRVRKIILARHHAFPLAAIEIDGDTAYGSWPQFFNAGEYMLAKQGDFRTLEGLFQILREYVVGAPMREHEDLEPLEYRLANVAFRIRQSNHDTGNVPGKRVREERL